MSKLTDAEVREWLPEDWREMWDCVTPIVIPTCATETLQKSLRELAEARRTLTEIGKCSGWPDECLDWPVEAMDFAQSLKDLAEDYLYPPEEPE